MKKISEYENEEALDLLADILEPAVAIINDPETKKMYKAGEKRIKLAQYIIKEHKEEIITILARLEGVSVEDYKCNPLTLPISLLQLLNDKELLSFFTETAQM